jgi:hypothetical protein
VIDQRILDLPARVEGVTYAHEESPMGVAYRIVLNRHQLAYEGEHDPRYEFDCTLTVLPTSGELLALLATSRPPIQRVWEATEGVFPMPYWSEGDPPEGVSEAEWAVREGLWAEVLEAGHTLDARGYTTSCFGRYGIPVPAPADVLSRLPTTAQRAQVFAVDRAVARRFRQENTKTRMGKELALAGALQWATGSRDGHAMVEGEREHITQMLPTITEAMLIA